MQRISINKTIKSHINLIMSLAQNTIRPKYFSNKNYLNSCKTTSFFQQINSNEDFLYLSQDQINNVNFNKKENKSFQETIPKVIQLLNLNVMKRIRLKYCQENITNLIYKMQKIFTNLLKIEAIGIVSWLWLKILFI